MSEARSDEGLAGQFLIAMPSLADPNFHRTVVIMAEHRDDEGSLGFVVNRPTPLSVRGLCDKLGVRWEGDDIPLYMGGPVQLGSIWVLHGLGEEVPGSRPVCEGCWYTAVLEGLQVVAGAADAPRRVLGGYSGWGAHQLAGELREGAWLTAPGKAELVFAPDPEQTWEAALALIGIRPEQLVPGADDMQ